jgi:hypothetical protein
VKFAFLLGVFYFIGTWVVLFGLLPKERNVIFWSSLAWGPAGPISEYWHRADYWRPDLILKINFGEWTFGLEDYLFAFAFGGICTGIFELLMKRLWKAKDIRFGLRDLVKLACVVMLSLTLMGVLFQLFYFNSLYAISISFLLLSGFIIYRRPKFFLPSLITAFVMMGFMWLFYWGFFLRLYPDVLGKYWLSSALSGITIANVPIDEVIWAGLAALFVGPAARYSLTIGAAKSNGKAS